MSPALNHAGVATTALSNVTIVAWLEVRKDIGRSELIHGKKGCRYNPLGENNKTSYHLPGGWVE